MNKEELNDIVCQSSSDYEILDNAYDYIEKLEKEKQELIDYLKEQIKETKDSWGNCIYYNNEKGMLEILITLRLLEEILNKIEKR